jgi:hypothetical protein
MQSLETPDVTSVQKLVAAGLVLLGSLVALVNAFEWADVDAGEAASITGVYAAFGSVIVLADAIIRNGRSRAFSLPPKGLVAEDESGTKPSSTRRLGA